MRVDPLAAVCVLAGVLIIASRGPMIFAPMATLRTFRRLIATDARVRIVGALLPPLSWALIALPRDEPAGADLLHFLGWFWAGAAVWLLAVPGSYRKFALDVLDLMESSVDGAIIRATGVVAVGLGAAIIAYGVYVV